MNGQDSLIISKAILDELLTTLARKFSRDQEELAHIAVFLAEIGTVVHPKRRVRILKDDPDNRVLECAAAGRADAVVTGDRAMLSVGRYHEIPILPLATYLALP